MFKAGFLPHLKVRPNTHPVAVERPVVAAFMAVALRIPASYPSRSEEDQADARRIVYEGMIDDEITDVLADRESVQDRGRSGEDYMARTISKARTWTDEHVPLARICRTKIEGKAVAVLFEIEEGVNKGKRVSKDRWAALLKAVGKEAIVRPGEVVGARFCVELIVQGGHLCVGRVFPPRTPPR
jgi:hypothetical protein